MTEEKNQLPFRIQVCGSVQQAMDLEYSDFANGTFGAPVDVQPLVPAFSGQAAPVSALFLRAQPSPSATHAVFHASDEFQAILPLTDLEEALLLFQQENGEPLKKGFPVRLLVPNGSSDCLNVKSVIKIELVSQETPEQKATFGFKNTISATDL